MTNGQSNTVAEAVNDVRHVINDLKEELTEFVNTRVAILTAEMRQKFQTIMTDAPMFLVGLLLLATAWFTFTGFLVCIIAQAFIPHAWAYLAAFGIVTLFYAIVGSGMAWFAWKAMKSMGLKPKRTIQVLQQDRIWLQTEARTQL